MKGIQFQKKTHSRNKFYRETLIPRMPDETVNDKVDYNYLVAKQLKSLGFSVTQELTLPEWGAVDIFAHKNGEVYVIECKSEKDRSMMRALGQIVTYTSQLHEVGYNIKAGIIVTRTEPVRQRIKKELEFLNKHLPFNLYIQRVSNKTPLIKLNC